MDKIIILGHENPDVDSIVSGYLLEKIMRKKGYNVEFVIPDKKIDKDSLRICKKYNLDPVKYKKEIDLNDTNMKYILVDHNERQLNGEIVCIIDHHYTSKKFNIKNYYNKKISSTACYISMGNEFLLDEFDLKLAVVATLVDTVSFHSNKGRIEDKEWVIDICNKYRFNYDYLSKEGLGLTPLDSIYEFCLNGLKKYYICNKKVHSSYVQINGKLSDDSEQNILDILKEYINSEGIYAFVFIVHDMINFKTMYYLINNGVVETRYYGSYVSRGDTIIPEIEIKLK